MAAWRAQRGGANLAVQQQMRLRGRGLLGLRLVAEIRCVKLSVHRRCLGGGSADELRCVLIGAGGAWVQRSTVVYV